MPDAGIDPNRGGRPLAVTTSSDAAALVDALVADNAGITVVGGSPLYIGASNASGFFSGGAGILPFPTGVVLTTGNAPFVIGPNTSPAAGVDNNAPGDAGLSAIVGTETHNASVLQFRFTSTQNTISFQYVFGSEEYNEFVGSQFNDVFAFLLNGNNIALVPGTSTPIAINNVNNGANSNLFTDNTGNALNTELDGLVGVQTALFATASVTPGAENTIRIAIADTSDEILDSAVFLRAGSFVSGPPVPEQPTQPPGPPTSVPEPMTLTLLGSGMTALALLRKRFGHR
ncbi:MAG TPA: choice-of-anchor L domain-containing protein [Methylomirabilota bacterium]